MGISVAGLMWEPSLRSRRKARAESALPDTSHSRRHSAKPLSKAPRLPVNPCVFVLSPAEPKKAFLVIDEAAQDKAFNHQRGQESWLTYLWSLLLKTISSYRPI